MFYIMEFIGGEVVVFYFCVECVEKYFKFEELLLSILISVSDVLVG